MIKYCFYILFFSYFLFPSEIINKVNNQLNMLFPDYSIKADKYNLESKLKKEIEKNIKQKFFRDDLYVWEVSKSDSNSYYVVLDNVIGKSMPITFLIIFNSDQSIYKTSIIKYREPYGAEVGGKNWLRQFDAGTKSTKFKVGENINGITGATISVHSVTKGINKLTHLIEHIINYMNEE